MREVGLAQIAALIEAPHRARVRGRGRHVARTPEIDDVAPDVIVPRRPEVVNAKARAEGIARDKAEALIAMLDARGVALASADRERILHEQDPATLARWIALAATCADIAALFEEPAV